MFNKKAHLYFYLKLVFLILAQNYFLNSDVKSTLGKIDFFSNQASSEPNMTLDNNGLMIGQGTPQEKLQVNGNMMVNELSVGEQSNSGANLNISGTYGISSVSVIDNSTSWSGYSMVFADTNSGNIIMNLPSANNILGREYTIKMSSTLNQLWINSSDNIENARNSYELKSDQGDPYPSIRLMASHQGWYVLGQSSGVSNSVAQDNLLLWYRLDDSSGNLAGDETGNFVGQLVGGADFNSDSTEGVSNQGLQLDGIDDGIDIGDVIIDDATALSVSFWVKLNTVASDYRLINKGTFGISSPFVIWRDDNAFVSGRTDTISVLVDSSIRLEGQSGALNDSDWHHIVVTFSGNNTAGLRLYVDGNEDPNSGVSTTSLLDLKNDAGSLFIGKADTDSATLNGSVDSIKFFNKVLTSEEVTVLYNEGT